MSSYTGRYVDANNEIKQYELNKIQELFIKDVVDRHLDMFIEKSVDGLDIKPITSGGEIGTLLSIWHTLLSRLIAEGNGFSTVCRKDCPFNIRIYETDTQPEIIYTLKAIDPNTAYGPGTLRERARKKSPPITTIMDRVEEDDTIAPEFTVQFMVGLENYIQQITPNQREFIYKVLYNRGTMFTYVLKFSNTTKEFIYDTRKVVPSFIPTSNATDIISKYIVDFFDLAGKYNASVRELSEEIPFFFDNSIVEDAVENDYVVGLVVLGIRTSDDIIKILQRAKIYDYLGANIIDKLPKELKDNTPM